MGASSADSVAGSTDATSATTAKAGLQKGRHTAPDSPSQISTAPCTPLMWPLADEIGIACEELPTAAADQGSTGGRTAPTLGPEEVTEPDVTCLGLPPLQSELAKRVQALQRAEEWLQKRHRRCKVALQPASAAPDNRVRKRRLRRKGRDRRRHQSQAPTEWKASPPQLFKYMVIPFAGMPPLQSELGRWAQEAVQATGMPPLQSDLAKWAQAVVQAEDWLEEERHSRGILPAQQIEEVDAAVSASQLRGRRPHHRHSARRQDSNSAVVVATCAGAGATSCSWHADSDGLHAEESSEISAV